MLSGGGYNVSRTIVTSHRTDAKSSRIKYPESIPRMMPIQNNLDVWSVRHCFYYKDICVNSFICVKIIVIVSDIGIAQLVRCHCALGEPMYGGTVGIFKEVLHRLRMYGNRYSLAIVLDHRSNALTETKSGEC